MKTLKTILQGVAVSMLGTGAEYAGTGNLKGGAALVAGGLGTVFMYEHLQARQSQQGVTRLEEKIQEIEKCLTLNDLRRE